MEGRDNKTLQVLLHKILNMPGFTGLSLKSEKYIRNKGH